MMVFNGRDVRWTGSLRFTPLILTTIILLSITTLGLSFVHRRELAARHVWYQGGKPPSKALLVFYCLTMPFLSLFHSSTDLILFFRSGLAPVYSLVGSILFFGGWLTQWSLLIDCEALPDGNGIESWCPNKYLSDDTDLDNAIVLALTGLETALVIAYLVYLGFATTAVHRERRERTRGQKLGGKGELKHELDQVP